MLAIIVPAHNEEDYLGACLASLEVAARDPELFHEPVLIIVVLDSCTDATESIARSWNATTVTISAQNVGLARREGAEVALSYGARWLAFTDADSTVADDWLSVQLGLNADAVCGTVSVSDWEAYGDAMGAHFAATYNPQDNHRHIHGANLGVSAEAYMRTGGFQALTSSEDVALVKELEATGALIAWSGLPLVVTSARAQYKAPHGFGATLQHIALTAQSNAVGDL